MNELPKIRIGKKSYYIDVRLKQLRNINNPHDYIDMNGELLVAVKLKN